MALMNIPQVGLGVIITRADGEILIAKREGSHAPYYSIPGGKLELGETFEAGAAREVMEELGIEIHGLQVIAVTNNLDTYHAEGLHFISVILVAGSFTGTPAIMEPDRCSELLWASPSELPEPHFEASRKAVSCWLEKLPYSA